MLQQEVRNDPQAWQEQHVEALVRNLQEMHIHAQQQQNQPVNNMGNIAVGLRAQPQFQQMRMDDAITYVNSVKQTFRGRPQMYYQFLEIIYEYQKRVVDMPAVLRRITLVFDGYPELINGFQAFVPGLAMPNIEQARQEQRVNDLAKDVEGVLHIQQQPAPPANNVAIVNPNPRPLSQLKLSQLKIEEGLIYLDMVKRTYQDRPQVYQEFLSTMRDFKNKITDHQGVIRKVVQLFDGHPHLIYGFQTFLPPGLTMPLLPN